MNQRLEEIYLQAIPVWGYLYGKNMPIQNKENMIRAVRAWPLFLQYLDNPDEDVCMEAVAGNGHALAYVIQQTPEICAAAVCAAFVYDFSLNPFTNWEYADKFDGECKHHEFTGEQYIRSYRCGPLFYVKNQTEELVLLALSNGCLWTDKCIRIFTPEICQMIVDRYTHKIHLIPKEHLSEELIWAAIERQPFIVRNLIDPTDEMQMLFLEKYPRHVSINPRKPFSVMLIEEAYERNRDIAKYFEFMDAPPTHLVEHARKYGYYFGDVEEITCDPQLILKNSRRPLKYIKDPTPEMIEQALNKNLGSILDVPNPTDEMLWRVVTKRVPRLIKNIVGKLSQEMIDWIIDNDSISVKYMPTTEPNLWRMAKSNPRAFIYLPAHTSVPNEIIDYLAIHHLDHLANIVERQGWEYANQVYQQINSRTVEQLEENQIKSVMQDGLALAFIENPSQDICFLALRQTGLALRHINNPTHEMILVALAQNPTAIVFLTNPDEHYLRVATGLADVPANIREFILHGDVECLNVN